ncbi:MAG: hypothetical protein AB8G77_08465 [Rhodothermales bacterium]
MADFTVFLFNQAVPLPLLQFLRRTEWKEFSVIGCQDSVTGFASGIEWVLFTTALAKVNAQHHPQPCAQLDW